MSIIYRYVFREALWPFLICLFTFTGILFSFRLLRLLELVVNKSVPVGEIVFLFLCVIPRFLEIALPMSLLLGVLIAFGRLSADSEVVVMRAAGISLSQLARPVIVLSAFATITTLLVSCWIRPWANYQLGTGLFNIAKLRATAGITPGVFNKFGALTVYSENASKDGKRLERVMISDNRDPNLPRVSVAKFGQLVSDDDARSLTLRLFDGSLFEGTAANFNLTGFDTNNISLDLGELNDGETTRGKKPSELTMRELSDSVFSYKKREGFLGSDERKRLSRLKVEWHKRFVLPFSCLAVGLIAMCLGIQPSRGGYSWGMSANIVIGVGAIVIYYLLFALVQALAKQSIAPAGIVLWLPNLVFLVTAVWFLKKISSEEWLAVSQAFGEKVEKLSAKLSKKKK